ncbi:MAG: hypothetical protein M1820_004255 [Bogoriella megaspora]|nr:MAG: hypothetical protein M1820_004255 [Bogoriella megaspora]
MDPLSVAASALGVVELSLNHIGSLHNDFASFRNTERLPRHDWTVSFQSRYGLVALLFVQIVLPNAASQLQFIEESILQSGDDLVLRFKESFVFDCNMIAVAGAIIAQIAITANAVNFLSQAHWLARAFWIASLVEGCLSVYYACLLQRTLGMLLGPNDIRDWLTRQDDHATSTYHLRATLEYTRELLGKKPETLDPLELEALRNYAHKNVGLDWSDASQSPPRSASLYSALLLGAPSAMITGALSWFLLGTGVYLGSVWKRNLDSAAGVENSRNVFIIFLIGTVFCGSVYPLLVFLKHREHGPVKLIIRIMQNLDALKKMLALRRERIITSQLESDLMASFRSKHPMSERGLLSVAPDVDGNTRLPQDQSPIIQKGSPAMTPFEALELDSMGKGAWKTPDSEAQTITPPESQRREPRTGTLSSLLDNLLQAQQASILASQQLTYELSRLKGETSAFPPTQS